MRNSLWDTIKSATREAFGIQDTQGAQKMPGPAEKKDSSALKAIADISDLPALGQVYNRYTRVEVERRRKYTEFDVMDRDSDVVATALDLYTEDATYFDTFANARLWVSSQKEGLAQRQMERLGTLRYDTILPRIARNVAKYGDFWPHVVPHDNRKKGIRLLDTSYHPKNITPIAKNYRLVAYYVMTHEQSQATAKDIHAPWEFVHFAIPGASNIIDYDNLYDATMERREDRVEFGQSMLDAARRAYKRSRLMHDVLAVARMSRSPLKRVFKFQTESDDPTTQIQRLALFKKTMEKIGGVNKLDGDMNYDELMNIMLQDIYLPIGKDSKGDYSFDTVGGEVDVSNISDIDMWDNRFYMTLRIPKEYLNFNESMGDKQTLLLKDIRYAKRLRRIQWAIKAGTKELLLIDAALRGEKLDENDFEIEMASTSASEDLERLDYYNNAVSTADTLVRTLSTFEESAGGSFGGDQDDDKALELDKGYLLYYIMNYVVKLPGFDLGKYFAKAADYAEASSPKIKKTKKMVERYKHVVKSVTNENFNRATIVERLNNHLTVNIEDIRAGKIDAPTYESLRSIIESTKSVIEKMKKESNVIGF